MRNIMNKKLYLLGLALFSILLISALASAGYSYYSPSYSYNYPAFQQPTFASQEQKFPSFINLPTVRDISANRDFSTSSYNRNLQGAVYERTYDEFTTIKRNGKLIRSVSERTRFVGPSEVESRLAENKIESMREYSSIPQNPSFYDGGYISNTQYTIPYYTNGYYCWRYNRYYC